jgi:large subunit ribosomal protein L32
LPKQLNNDNLDLLIIYLILDKYMPVARQRHTKARRDRARVFYQLKPKKLVECKNCKAKILPHITCPKCGFYKGKEIIDTTKKLKAK